MDKSELKKRYKEQELQKFRLSLPINEKDFLPIFDFLDVELRKKGCKGDFGIFEEYCRIYDENVSLLSEWFRKNGGYCDCEILANVEEKFEYLNRPSEPVFREKKLQVEKLKITNLSTNYGFLLKNVPSPWSLIQINDSKENRYQFQIGKKTDCILTLLRSFTCHRLSDNNYLKEYWISQTDLSHNLDFDIERFILLSYEVVIVKTKAWIPVFIFIKKTDVNWGLIMKTGVSRMRSDLKQLESLISVIECAD